MKKFNVVVDLLGFATITAETKEDAVKTAKEMGTEDFDWGVDFEVVSCEEE